MNETIDGEIKRPQFASYDVYHEEDAYVNQTTTYKQNVQSFLELNEDILDSMRSNDYYNYWDGDVVDRDETYYETTGDRVSEIDKLKAKS